MESKFNPDYTYTGRVYKRENSKDILVNEKLIIYYYDEEDKWITWDNYLMYCVEPIMEEKKYTKEELKRARVMLEGSLMPYHDIKEGDTYIDASSIELMSTRHSDPGVMYDKLCGPSWRKMR